MTNYSYSPRIRHIRPVRFAPWQESQGHRHQLEEVRRSLPGGSVLVLDRCNVDGCMHEVGRDLITPGDTR